MSLERLRELSEKIPHSVRLHRGNVNAYGAEVLQDLCFDNCVRCGLDEIRRQLSAPASEQPALNVTQVEDIHRIIERWSTDVVDYESAADDISAYLFGGIVQPESIQRAAASTQGLREALRNCVAQMKHAADLLEFMPDDYAECIRLSEAALAASKTEQAPTAPVEGSAPPKLGIREVWLKTVRDVLDNLLPDNSEDAVFRKDAAEAFIKDLTAPKAGEAETAFDARAALLGVITGHRMTGSNPDAPLEKICECGQRFIGLLAQDLHEKEMQEEAVKAIWVAGYRAGKGSR